MLSDKIYRYPRQLLQDDRGWFLKIITGKEDNLPKATGEIYFTCAKPGQRKGGHYHKLAQEWFTMIVGEGVLLLEDIQTKERMEIKMSANKPETIFIPRNVAHIIINNTQKDNILCAYTDILYNPNDTITYDF